MTISHSPGTLGATRWAGSAPIAFDASRITSGTVASPRVPVPTFVAAVITAGTTVGNLRAPPGKTRRIAISAALPAGNSRPFIHQSRYGTVDVAGSSTGDLAATVVLGGWLTGAGGSYRVGTAIAGAVTFERWVEWTEQ